MTKEIALEDIEIYKKKGEYIARLEPLFYVDEAKFDKMKDSCSARTELVHGYSGLDYKQDCAITETYCSVNACTKVTKDIFKPEHQLRKELAKRIDEHIKMYQRRQIDLDNRIRLAEFDKESTSDLERGLSETEDQLDILQQIDPKSIQLEYRPTPKIVYSK
jgi:hypothetical protein